MAHTIYMADMARRLAWFFIVASAVSYACFLILGSTIQARADSDARTVFIRDVREAGVHRLSGMVMVQSTCADLYVRAEQHSNTNYGLVFSTWEQPALECARESVPRAFNAIVFAPAVGVHFTATLDGKPLPIVVVPVYQ